MTVSTFSVPTRIVSGIGALSQLQPEVEALGSERLAVIADEGVERAGVLGKVLAHLSPGLACLVRTVPPESGLEVAESAAEAAREAGADAVLAVGGGSALGVGKAVAIRLTNDEPIEELGGLASVPVRPAKVVAVPTTAGSGSEVSKSLVLHDPGRPREFVVRGGEAPATAILDGTVLRTLPERPLLYAALDALSHAVESTWARRRSSFADAMARAAVQTIVANLPEALAGHEDGRNPSGKNDAVLQALLEASCTANLACGNTGLTLVHALSSATAVTLPHGLKNGILLPVVAEWNRPEAPPLSEELMDAVLGLYERVGFDSTFPDGGVGDDGVRAMVHASTGHPFRKNNCRAVSDDELEQLLQPAIRSSPERPAE